jgi:hypothetical protein
MFFFSLALFLVGSWCLPWWVVVIGGLMMGWFQPRPWNGGFNCALAAAVAWAALAYIEDGRNHGLVSKRLAGLFHLPHASFTYLIMGLCGFITVFLCARSAMTLRSWLCPKDR